MKKSLVGVSLLTITCLYGLLSAVIILIAYLTGQDIGMAIYISIGIIIIQFLIAPWLTDLTMKWFYKANFGEQIPDYLKEFIESICKKHNMKYPKIGIIHDGSPNAFTYGRFKNDARIVLTDGIFELLTEDEVKSVVAHELGHVVHYDMLIMTAVQIIPLIFYAIYEGATDSNVDDKDDAKIKAIIAVIAYILYIISQYLILWLSRTREYKADAFSVDETKKPSVLAEALVKIGFGLSTTPKTTKHNVSKNNALGIFDVKTSKSMTVCSIENGKVSKDKIKNAMKWELWNPWAKWYELNSTHPLISKRLQEISSLSSKYNEEPYIIFDLEKPESYIDDFFKEILILCSPTIALIVTLFIIIFFNSSKYVILLGGLTILALSYMKFKIRHKSNYKKRTVSDLLGEVKVSNVTSIPCELTGTIIGRGNPGCIFNEDFVIKDETGIIFLDYNQPLFIVNKIFALFKLPQNFGKEITIKGWYRRSPVPYVEIYEMTIDGKSKKIWTYSIQIALYIIALLGLFIFILK